MRNLHVPDHRRRAALPDDPDAAIRTFNYLRTVQADDVDAARELVGTELRIPKILDVAERIVVPVTALPGPNAGEPCADTLPGRHSGASSSPLREPGRRPGQARHLTEDHENIAVSYASWRQSVRTRPLDAHPAPAGAYPVRLTIV
ncbi:hypothetical protein [Streptomyces syringium]|uniref:hypothetical protein n=1 Tax=Streptomyces syringium TaxID=76729 RepID=UPI0037D983C6